MVKDIIKQKNIGWSEWLIIGAFVIIGIWSFLKKRNLDANAAFTKGVITGTHPGAKGSIYLDFEFYTGEEKVNSWSPLFKGWKIRDSIIIKYNRDKPHDNDIVNKIPEGKILE